MDIADNEVLRPALAGVVNDLLGPCRTPQLDTVTAAEAVALAACDAGVALGTGYPGTPSTEILEAFKQFGGRAQWAPNEKVALEVGIGKSDGFQHGAGRCAARSVEQIVAFVSWVDRHGNSFIYGIGRLPFSMERVQIGSQTFA